MLNGILSGSFRDPSGFLFWKDGKLFRQINTIYKDDFDFLIQSGLYEKLVHEKSLVSHLDAEILIAPQQDAYRIIQPEMVPFISYPSEWSFGQLKDASLLTLSIQLAALEKDMTLKDASVYNIQFKEGKPIFIDTLSFEKYLEGSPWIAYKQFCQHFLAPLALMAYTDIRLNQLFRIYMDGIPLDLASSLLPYKTRFNFTLLSHIHLHSGSQKHYADKAVSTASYKVSKFGLLAIIDGLQSFIQKLEWKKGKTEWGAYYSSTNYSDSAFQEKKSIISRFIDSVKPATLWDLGANTGYFSRTASDKGISTIAFDIDPIAVELGYQEMKEKKEKNILPLLLDLTNPTPSTGWHNQERLSFLERGPADMVMALAIIHHIAISNNVPLEKAAYFFSTICRYLIIEFVPKSDSQVQRLLRTRKDIFINYTLEGFTKAFENFFHVKEKIDIPGSERVLFLMEKR